METGCRGGERRLRGASSLQGKGPGVEATEPRDAQRSGLGDGRGSVRQGLGLGSREAEGQRE